MKQITDGKRTTESTVSKTQSVKVITEASDLPNGKKTKVAN